MNHLIKVTTDSGAVALGLGTREETDPGDHLNWLTSVHNPVLDTYYWPESRVEVIETITTNKGSKA